MKLSDVQIKHVLDKAAAAWKINKLTLRYKDNYLLTLKTFLQKGGITEDVCHSCLGTGEKIKG